MRTWLVLDSNYLCHRAFYTTGNLSFGDTSTGVVFGFMRDITTLQDQHDTSRIVFCFDHGKSVRTVLCPGYKSSRRAELDDEQQELQRGLRTQIKILRTEILPDLGFNNVFSQHGYEADDMIASVVHNMPEEDRAIIISSDHDLFQLLSARVMMYNPHKQKMTTAKSFSKEYGISPTQWIDVKAMAGCHSDDIPGIKGIGEIRAAKFLSGRLKAESKAFQMIVQGNKIWKRNRNLVRLPYPGTRTFELVRDEFSRDSWRELCDSMGMDSLRNKPPTTVKERTHGKKKKQSR